GPRVAGSTGCIDRMSCCLSWPACPGHPRLYANGQRPAEFAWGSWMAFAEPRPFSAVDSAVIRHDWTRAEVRALFALPFPDLIFRAQTIHRQHFDPTEVQISTLISIK